MKSLRGNIFEQIASVENIVAAIHSAAKGKRHKRAVRYAEAHAEEVAARLHDELVAGTWMPPAIHVGRVELRDRIYLNGRRLGARLIKKRKGGGRLTAYDAQKMTSYSARFKAFGCYRAFVAEVLHNGKLTMSDMASIISRHDRAKAKARKSDVQKN